MADFERLPGKLILKKEYKGKCSNQSFLATNKRIMLEWWTMLGRESAAASHSPPNFWSQNFIWGSGHSALMVLAGLSNLHMVSAGSLYAGGFACTRAAIPFRSDQSHPNWPVSLSELYYPFHTWLGHLFAVMNSRKKHNFFLGYFVGLKCLWLLSDSL